MSDEPTKPDLTPKEDEVSKTSIGQRRINLIWEITQALIAGSVVSAVLYTTNRMIMKSLEPSADQHLIANSNLAFVFLAGVANLVIGFYFGRTNHQRVGGLGARNEDSR